jgi:hypothetical protein
MVWMTPVKTVAGDFFANLEKLMAWQPGPFGGRRLEARVAYGGDQRQVRRKVEVVPWDGLKDIDWW